MIKRRIYQNLVDQLDQSPAVALLGPRQAGKTTLAHELAITRPSIYLDLESDTDRNKLTEPELYLSSHQDKLVILDEIHRLPGLFRTLRGLIDKARRGGKKSGQFLLLGSASLDLMKQSSESLAGRVAYVELGPFDVTETENADQLWLRGGFPDSLTAASDLKSLNWRKNFIRSYLERGYTPVGTTYSCRDPTAILDHARSCSGWFAKFCLTSKGAGCRQQNDYPIPRPSR